MALAGGPTETVPLATALAGIAGAAGTAWVGTCEKQPGDQVSNAMNDSPNAKPPSVGARLPRAKPVKREP